MIASSTSRPTGNSPKSVGMSRTVSTVATAARATPPRIGRMYCARLGRLEVAEQDGQEQHDLEPLTEQDEERLGGDDGGRAQAGVGEPALGVVHQPAQHDDLVADLLDRRAAADHLADLGELGLGLDREVVVGDPERDLDQLEVRQVAVAGLLEGLVGLPRLDQLEGPVDRAAGVLELGDALVAADRAAVGRAAMPAVASSPITTIATKPRARRIMGAWPGRPWRCRRTSPPRPSSRLRPWPCPPW